MSFGILRVTATKKPPYRTKVSVCSTAQLADFGFVYDAPVWATPQLEGFTLALLEDEHREKDSGKLIHVGRTGNKLVLTLNFAKNFSVVGLSAGDFLAARYEYGVITARKLPQAQKYYVVGAQDYCTFLQLCGAWLNDAGFLPYTIVTVAVQQDFITLRLWDDPAATYSDIVKVARMHQYQVIQPQRNQHFTIINLDDYLLNRAGLDTGDIAGVHYEYGCITLFKPDLQKLGF